MNGYIPIIKADYTPNKASERSYKTFTRSHDLIQDLRGSLRIWGITLKKCGCFIEYYLCKKHFYWVFKLHWRINCQSKLPIKNKWMKCWWTGTNYEDKGWEIKWVTTTQQHLRQKILSVQAIPFITTISSSLFSTPNTNEFIQSLKNFRGCFYEDDFAQTKQKINFNVICPWFPWGQGRPAWLAFFRQQASTGHMRTHTINFPANLHRTCLSKSQNAPSL